MYPDDRVCKLFMQYIDVCEKAIDLNKEKFPFTQIWNAISHIASLERIPARMLGGVSAGDFSLGFHQHKITVTPDDHDGRAVDYIWVVDEGYIAQVIGDPAPYLHNPAKLNWEWLDHYLSLQGKCDVQAEHENSANC